MNSGFDQEKEPVDDAGDLPLRIELLGPPAAWRGGTRLRLGPPRQVAVLAMLAVHADRYVTRVEIIDGVWGDASPQSADSSVHTYVSGLRHILEPRRGNRQPGRVVLSRDSTYRLQLPAGRIDYALFGQYLAGARASSHQGDLEHALASFDAALSLCRGPALGGVPGPFAEAEQLRHEELKLTALEQRGDVLLALGRHLDLAADLATLTRQYPLRERFRYQFMLALYRSERQADALTEYQEARRCLVDELGVEPGESLRTLYDQILRGDTALTLGGPQETAVEVQSRTVPAQLPRNVRHFTGRARELSMLDQVLAQSDSLQDESAPIVLITGPAGVGKTSLAVYFGHAISRCFADGQLYVNLHGFDGEHRTPSTEAVLVSLLGSLGVHGAAVPVDLDGLLSLYRSVTSTKQLLVMLDNAGNTRQVRHLLPGGTQSAVIVTSRARLAGLVARDGAQAVVLLPMETDDSLGLLAGVIGRPRVDADREAALRLAGLCGGLPLAIRIAAERVATRSHLALADVVRDLTEEADRLDALAVHDDEETTRRPRLAPSSPGHIGICHRTWRPPSGCSACIPARRSVASPRRRCSAPTS